jgi:hypothetical protein
MAYILLALLLGFWGYKINANYEERDKDPFFSFVGFLIGFFFNLLGIAFLYLVRYIRYH